MVYVVEYYERPGVAPVARMEADTRGEARDVAKRLLAQAAPVGAFADVRLRFGLIDRFVRRQGSVRQVFDLRIRHRGPYPADAGAA